MELHGQTTRPFRNVKVNKQSDNMRKLSTLLLLSCLSVSAALPSSPNPDDSPLVEAMSELNSSLRKFRRAVKAESPDQAVALAELLKMQAAAHASKLETPEKAKADGLSAADARAMTRDYRKALISCEKALLDLEVLILDEKYSEVDVAIRGLLEIKKGGHDKFIEDA